ncbi:MAG: hypothetical protein ACI381_09580, partial [Candidatus Methanomethylophilaceae archaeon]
WARLAVERGLPVMTEKPMAMDLPTLEGLFQAARKTGAALVPMHTMRGVAELAAVSLGTVAVYRGWGGDTSTARSAVYALAGLKGLFAAVPGDPLCDMRFGTDYPLTMGFKVGYLDVLYLIAPRIESE